MTVIVEKQLSTSATFQALESRVDDLEAAGGGTVSDWGDIGGTLADQTDLQTALNTKADDSAAVHKTGNETVAGVKTFSSSPIVPTPSSSTQAANKSYVDSVGGGTVINNTVTVTGGNMVALSGYASLAAACTAIGSTVRTPLLVDTDKNVAALTTVTANILLVYGGGKLTITTGSIVFQGQGFADPESQLPIIYGADPGDVTFTGTVYPKVLSSALWDTGNSNILSKGKLADAAVVGKVCKILLFDGEITGGASASDSFEVTTNHHLYVMGELTNTWDASLTAAIPFLLNSYTSFRSSPGAKIYESSVNGAYNMSIIIAKMMTVSGASGTCTNIYVEDNYFVGDEGQSGSGGLSTVHLGNVTNGGINRNIFNRTHGYNCFGGYGTTGNCAENVTFLDNLFLGCGTQVCAVINARNFRIAGNIFDQRNSNAQTAYSPFDVEPNTDDDIVENGIIEYNYLDCRDYGHTVSTGLQILGNGRGSAKNIIVRHNTIIGTDIITSETTQPLIIPISITGIEEGYVYGNTIRGASQGTVFSSNCRHLFVWDNNSITQFGLLVDSTIATDIRMWGCADSYVYDNHLRKATNWSVTPTQTRGIYEHELYIPFTASGSTLSYVGGFWGQYFRDFWTGLKGIINNTEYTFGTYTNGTTIATTSSVGTVATKTFTSADVNTTTNVINKTGHGFVTGSFVMATTTGTLPSPMPAANLFYGQVFLYVIKVDNDNFKLALTLADALASTAIDLTAGGTGTHTLTNILVTKFSNNRYSNNEAADGIRLEPSGTSEALSTYHDRQITNVADTAYTATTASGIIVYTSLTAGRTINLPDATTCRGKEIIVKDGAGTAGSNNLTLDGNGSQTIDGSSTKAISTNYGTLRVKSNGSNWITV